MPMVLFGILGALITIGLYGLLRVSWPRLYYGPDDTFETFISYSFWSYLAFRTLPVALAIGSLGAYATRASDASIWILVVSFLFAYPSATSLLTVIGRRRNARTTSRLDVEWIATSSVIVTIGAVFGALLAPWMNKILPPGEALVEAIITALFVAALAVLGRAMQLDTVQFDGVIDRTMKRTARQLAEVEDQCARLRVPAEPFMAILVAENLQRPRWFRRFEYTFSRISPSKTTGPFQLPSSRAAGSGTAESINISEYLKENSATALLVERGAPRRSSARSEMFSAIYALHNPSSKFVKLCDRIATRFRPKRLAHYVELDAIGVDLLASPLMVSGKNVTTWLGPSMYREHGELSIMPPGASSPLKWRPDEDDSISYSAAASVFYGEWGATYTISADSTPKTAKFHIQDWVPTEPRWS